MKKGDAFIILIAVLLLCVWIFPSHKGEEAAIYINGELYRRLPLSEDASLVVESEFGTNTVVIERGTVRVTDADCDGKDCEKDTISKTARSIVCLPNRLSIIIEGEKTEDETDVIL